MNTQLKNYVQLLGWTEESTNSLESGPRKWAIALLGPIASGKGTQADLLAQKFDLIHVENSKIIEQKFADAKPGDEEIERVRKEYMAGHWIDPEVMTKWALVKMKEVAESGKGIVMSSPFRTQYETEKELEFFEENYGKENIKVFSIELSEAESTKRSLGRRICKANRHPIPDLPEFKNMTACPQDGSELVTRVLDKPDLIKVRYQEHLTRTKPVFDFLRSKGYEIMEINGEQSIEDVFKEILSKLNDKS